MAPFSILVVDDNVPFRTVVCRALAAAGHTVENASDGEAAKRAIDARPPQLVITDIMMPDGDGIGLITWVRRTHPDVRILAMSGSGMMGKVDLLDVASKLGAHATIPKPGSTEDLLASVADAMG